MCITTILSMPKEIFSVFRARLITFFLFLMISIVPASFAGVWETIEFINNELKMYPKKKLAILVIDMELGHYTRGHFDAAEFLTVISNQIGVIKYFTGNKRIVFVDVNYLSKESNFGTTMRPLSDQLENTKKDSLFRSFLKQDIGAFEKPPLTVFEDRPDSIKTMLAEALSKLEVKTIVPMGCFLSSCVLQTVTGALDRRFRVGLDFDLNLAIRSDLLNTPLRREQFFKFIKSQFEAMSQVGDKSLRMITRPSAIMNKCQD